MNNSFLNRYVCQQLLSKIKIDHKNWIYFWAHGCWLSEFNWIWLFLFHKHILNMVVGCTKIPFFTVRCIQSFDLARKNITLDLLLSFCATIFDYLFLVGVFFSSCGFVIVSVFLFCLPDKNRPANSQFRKGYPTTKSYTLFFTLPSDVCTMKKNCLFFANYLLYFPIQNQWITSIW